MAENFLSNDESIQGKWGPAPKLDAAPIGGVLEAILKNRQFQQLNTQKNIADTIKAIQQQRQGNAYTEALRNAGLTQGQDISGLSDPDATRLATLIQAQTPDTTMDAYHKALTAEAQARADALNDPDEGTYTTDPSEQRRQDAEKRREEDARMKAIKATLKASSLPDDAVPSVVNPKDPTTYPKPGTYSFSAGGKRTDIPQGQVNDFNAAKRVYDALNKERAAIPERPPAERGSGAGSNLAPGYGVKTVKMKAPDGTVSDVDPNLVTYYKNKGAVVVP
jgi:hypothetical protein